MLTVVIAEDDPVMRRILRRVITSVSGVSILGEAEDGRQLIELVEEQQPDVVFLDIDMPRLNGLEAAREIFDIDPKIILVFATGFTCYTREAFEVYAFDYLVKPFDVKRVRQTVTRIKELRDEWERLAVVKREQTLPKSDNPKLKIVYDDKSTYVNISEIILITRADRKTLIHAMGGSIVPTYESLHNLEERLMKYCFFRCHKGYIINPDMVLEISPWGNKSYLVRLANTKETALMTLEHVKLFQDRYCV
jgi:DNA-binding LytR/AlgR family response regulator